MTTNTPDATTDALVLTWLASLRPSDWALLHTVTLVWAIGSLTERQTIMLLLCARWDADALTVVRALNTLAAR